MSCRFKVVEEADDEHGRRRWAECRRCGAVKKQRFRNGRWVTVYVTSRNRCLKARYVR